MPTAAAQTRARRNSTEGGARVPKFIGASLADFKLGTYVGFGAFGFVPSFGALTTDCTSSELMRRERSAFFIIGCGRRYGVPPAFFVDDGFVSVP